MIATAHPNRVFAASPPRTPRGRPGDWLGLLGIFLVGWALGVFVGLHADGSTVECQRVCPPGIVCPTPATRPSASVPRLGPADGVPLPWETAVRIQVSDGKGYGTGSGTVIDGDPDRALILTCAHLFANPDHTYGPPGSFAKAVQVDLFDGKQPAGFVETVPARLVDFDGKLDVGLVVIKPGRRLRSSPLIRDSFRPERGLKLVSIGCSDGKAPTAWSHVLRGATSGGGYASYVVTPKPVPGRSGGGLFTLAAEVVGVCNAADTVGASGFYAAPTSIKTVLDKNGRADLAHPPDPTPEPDPELAPSGRPHPQPPAPSPSPSPQLVAPDPPPPGPLGLDSSHFWVAAAVFGLTWIAGWIKKLGPALSALAGPPPPSPAVVQPPADPFEALFAAVRAESAKAEAEAKAKADAAVRAKAIEQIKSAVLPT